MKILTVAVPSYNVEKTLRDTLVSLCAEEIIDCLDIIVVNDGSTDLTLSAAEDFALNYPDSVRIITKNNGGHGSAVNCGIEAAKGKYFKVVDGDDRLTHSGLLKLVERLSSCETDIVLTNYQRVPVDGGPVETKNYEGVDYGRVYPFEELPLSGRLYFGIHTMTIKTSILKDNAIRLQENTFYVDAELGLLPVPYLKTVEFINKPVYLYSVGGTGQSTDFGNFVRRYDDHLRVVRRLVGFYNAAGCSPEQKKYMFNTLNKLCYTNYMLAALYDNNRARGRERAAEFDGWLSRFCPALYRSTGESFYIRFERLVRFNLLPGPYLKAFLLKIYGLLKPLLKKKRRFTY